MPLWFKITIFSSSNENDNIEAFDQIRSLKLMGKLTLAKRQITFQFNFPNLAKKRKGYPKTDICDAVVNKCCPRFSIANLARSKKEGLD